MDEQFLCGWNSVSKDGSGKRVLEEETLHVFQGDFPCFLLTLGHQEGPWGSFEFVLLCVPTLDLPEGLSPGGTAQPWHSYCRSHRAPCGVPRRKELKPSCPWLVLSSG